MTTTISPAWSTDYELEIIDNLINNYAPHIPVKRDVPRAIETKELDNFCRFRIRGAAHDLFIVQVCAKAINQIAIDDPELQLFLSHQLGDDGAHAQHTRLRVEALSGYDPIDEIQQQAKKHSRFMGDLPIRDWFGFLAFELHYELHIVASLILNKRLATINDPDSASFAVEKILPDEAFHRLGVVREWQRKYDKASPQEKKEFAAKLIEADEEGQRRRNSYLKEHWEITHRALGYEHEAEGIEVIYDAWRREVLAYLLDIPVSQLPKLVSVSEVN
ncbi:hypothetical protein NIES2101_34545 [Calothrix sp. HK-06]|nr:hypothetical protein NIES2101_34545 [Calothrix sp. HK-06]